MPHVQIRNIPEDVHSTLVRRAEAAGQSLQKYLAEQLTQMATAPTQAELFDRIEQRAKGRATAEDAVAAIEAERARR